MVAEIYDCCSILKELFERKEDAAGLRKIPVFNLREDVKVKAAQAEGSFGGARVIEAVVQTLDERAGYLGRSILNVTACLGEGGSDAGKTSLGGLGRGGLRGLPVSTIGQGVGMRIR